MYVLNPVPSSRLNWFGLIFLVNSKPKNVVKTIIVSSKFFFFCYRQFMEVFKRKIQSAVSEKPEKPAKQMPDPSAVVSQIAFYPVCSKNNPNAWLAENTAKLYFSPTLFDKLQPNTYLHKAELRFVSTLCSP